MMHHQSNFVVVEEEKDFVLLPSTISDVFSTCCD
jgi:hypothetical protein